jgi:hypothetical protein
MKTIASVLALLAIACGPVDAPAVSDDPQLTLALDRFHGMEPPHSTLFLERLTRKADGSLIAFAVESPELCVTPKNSWGCEATAWAMRWNGDAWLPFEMKPTNWEACDTLGAVALEAYDRSEPGDYDLQR